MFLKFLILNVLSFNLLFANEVITIKTRDNIKQRFLLNDEINEPKAIAILFAGGSGKLKLHKSKDEWKLGNFLIRSRNIFNENGIITISIDSPSDLKEGMKNGFRSSNEHLKDIENVINYIKNKYPKLPIWLVGTSRGTISASHNAINQSYISGLVLSSSMIKNGKDTIKTVLDLEIEKIDLPTLVIAHEKDSCKVTPPNGANKIYDKLENAIIKEVKIFSGGYENGNPCKGQSHHGFLGIEKEVVDFISHWIKSH